MTINLNNEFNQWIKQNKDKITNRKNNTSLIVIKHRAEIEDLLNYGCSLKTIFEFLKDKKIISCKYNAFRIHVNNLILHKTSELAVKAQTVELGNTDNIETINANLISNETEQQRIGNNQNKEPIICKTEEPKRFIHNSVPDLDLLKTPDK